MNTTRMEDNAAQPWNKAMIPEVWRYIFDAIEDPAFLHDAQFRVLLANRAYCREAGVIEAEALGKPYWEVFPPGIGPLPGCKDAVSRKGHTGSQEEVSVREKIFLSKSYVVCDSQGKPSYFLHLLNDITAQRQADAVLTESEERFRRATENARDAIITIDGEDGVVTEWNPAAEAIFGYSKEEATGRVLHETITPPRFREAAMKGIVHFASTGEGVAIDKTLELVALHKNGTEFPIELSLSAMQIHGKWFATGIVRDISERKRTEDSLKSLATKFSTLYESSSDAIMLLCDEEGFFDCNPATLRMFGCPTRDDFINKHPSQFSPPTQPGGESSMDLANQRIAAAFKNGSNHFEWVHCRLDGTEFPADVLLTAMQLDGKAVLLATVRDITERRLAEESVRIIQARFGTIFNQSPLGIALIDSLTGQICEVNPRFAEIVGRTIEEMATINWMSISHPDDVQEDMDNMALLNAGKIPGFKMDKRYIRPDSSIVWVDMTIAPLRGEKNISPRHLCMIDDITERKLTEEKIRQLNEELEAKVQERTKQLRNAQEELVRKEKLAVLGQVAGSVGHELRNPLGVMSNAVYFLQTVLADADETTKEYLDIIKDEIAGSERIVSDLLDSVRTTPPHPEVVGVAELIGQTLRKYTVPSSVTVKLDIPATLSPLRVDAMQTQQVFRNLISNGVEAMPEGGSLEISAVENKQDGTVIVSVRDSGIGMAPEVLTKLFQPLFTTKARGIGLGLVVVKNLTQVNGGRVDVQSEPRRGTMFTVTLPMDRAVEGVKQNG